jgi:hypothetical protein
MNKNPLFEPISPLTVWFWFLQLLTALCITGYWIEVFSQHLVSLTESIPVAACGTILFVVANFLIFRYRFFGVLGSVISWIWFGLILLPTL